MNSENTVNTLVEAMTNEWTSYGNTATHKLQTSWRQAFETFERKVSEHGTPHARDWHVLSPATGTGKSLGLKVYAANTLDNAPGIIIVVRLIAQADEFVSEINQLAGKDIAIAKHSAAAPINLEELRNFPVLVITHAAFTGRAQRDHELWEQYSAFDNAKRKLVVVDEALDILEISRVQSCSVERIQRMVPQSAWDRWPEARSAIDTLLDVLHQIELKQLVGGPTPKAQLLISEEKRAGMRSFEAGWDGLDQLEELRTWLKSDAHRYLIGKRTVDDGAESRQKMAHDAILKELISVYSNFIVHSRDGNRHTFSTARSLLPDEGQGCVVMDATANTNAIYECMASESLPVFKQPAVPCRNYGNATLKTSWGHSVGRNSLVKPNSTGRMPIQNEAPKLIAALVKDHKAREGTDCPMEKVLIVCHMAAEQHLKGFDTPFEYDVGHYGALDGKNDWREYDSVVIYGLDYRHPTDPGVSFLALQGEHKLDPFGDAGERSFGGHEDIVKALERGWIVSSLIQAVNRINTRRVIDAEGNCPRSFVYLALPQNAVGKAVYKSVQEQMPGIQVASWDAEIKKAPSRSKHEKSLEGLIVQMVPGEAYSATQLREQLSIPVSGWKKLTPKLSDETCSLGQLMAEKNVQYIVKRQGRSSVGRLVASG
ncbi:MAG: hypothetical protein NXH95_03210 [Pseudomonadaceae bacterium]|nr:hypothetical protein [Pseudomonadaceae bacterium]